MGKAREDLVIERARQLYREERAARPWWRKVIDALRGR